VGQSKRRFEFVGGQYAGSERAIGCDGRVPGASLDLTHWEGNRTPAQFKADTSTEIALKFVASPVAESEWASAVVVNNHFDTDGALSVWTLLHPEAATAQRDLLIAAAEAGDFDEWPAQDRGLWVDASIRALAADADDDAQSYDVVLPHIAELLSTLDDRRDLWGPEWNQLQVAASRLRSGELHAEKHAGIGLMIHRAGMSEAPGPLLARQFLPGAARYLLAFERTEGGFTYRYERPRYAWAETVVRPTIAAPDSAAIVKVLGSAWTDEGLPGMTGIAQTRSPVSTKPLEIVALLRNADPPSDRRLEDQR
jgi:hypothetical protein